ncbi:MAG TPA: hypothetical protein VGH28_04330 [Polyangiaceae bacterium]|jgi:hypothetical protein
MQGRKLKDDRRGAIMVIGIFFACVMIGWMWTLVGLGDAMIWRDRSQESVDSIVYTSAAIHARGMNFISFCNIVMLLITAVYLAMAVIFSISDFLMVITGRMDDKVFCPEAVGLPVTSAVCHDATKDEASLLLEETGIGEVLDAMDFVVAAEVNEPIHDGLQKGLDKYEKNVMWKLLPALSDASTKVAQIAPWAGAAVGALEGYRYVDWGEHRYGAGVSPSMFPASYFGAPVKKWSAENRNNPYTGRDGRLGLPVAIKEMGILCKRAGDVMIDGVIDMVTSILPGKVLKKVVGAILGWFKDKIASSLQDSYCSEKANGAFYPIDSATAFGWKYLFWAGGPNPVHYVYRVQKDGKSGGESLWGAKDKDGNPKYGPHEVVEYAENGNDWMQVWGAVVAGDRPEQSQKKVGAVYAPRGGAGSTETAESFIASMTSNFNIYFAQAEFYYDCTKTWEEYECNQDSNASYQMNWRVRLRRMHHVSWGQDVLKWFLGTSFSEEMTSAADGKIAKWVGTGTPIKSIVDKMGLWFKVALAEGVFKTLQTDTTSYVGGMISPGSVIPDTIH